ncbi:MAG TPA: ABC transporter substrate-binding protein [Chloroflexota bacterium]
MRRGPRPQRVHNHSTRRARSAVMLVIAGLLVLTGWTGARGVHAAGNHANARASSITDIINLPYPPMEFSKPGSSKVIGFDIDMATAIAKKLGDSISFQNVLFEQIIPSVKTHRGDFAWTAVFDLKAREQTLSFIDYFKTGSQVYTSTANAGKYKTIKSLCGQTVAVPKGTSFGQVVGRLSKANCGSSPMKQVTVASPTEQNLQIREGRAVAAISGPETVLYLQKQNPGKYALIGPIVEPDYYAVVFAKNNTALMNTVFAAMKAAWKDGTYRRILAKWGLGGAAIPQPLINHALH